MNKPSILIAAAFVAVAYLAWGAGHRSGTQGAPSVAAARLDEMDAQREWDQEFLAALNGQPDDRMKVCNGVFDLVAEHLAKEAFEEADDMDAHSQSRH